MKLLLLLLLFAISAINTQANEKQDPQSFNQESLYYAGKIWGFVKYYHPEVRTGKYNIDSLLVPLLDKVAVTRNLKQRNSVYDKWLSQFGSIEKTKSLVIKDSTDYALMYDYSWLTNQTFSKELSNKLILIKDAERKAESYYVDAPFNSGLYFWNEKFIEPDFTHKYQKLVLLFRYWNVIEYYFPYKDLTDKKWDDVLKEYISMFLNANNQRELNKVYIQLITQTNDAHGVFGGDKYAELYRDVPKKKNFTPITIFYIDGGYYVVGLNYMIENTGNINDYGFQIGDEIVTIDGKNPKEIIRNDIAKYYSTSNMNQLYNTYSNYLLRSDSTVIDVSYKRNGQVLPNKLKAGELKFVKGGNAPFQIDTLKITQDSIAYLNMSRISTDEIYNVIYKIQKTKGLIIDMRGYPNNDVISKLSTFINPLNQIFEKTSRVKLEYPGMIQFEVDGINNNIGSFDLSHYGGRVVVLVNHNTGSAAEYSTMKLQIAPNVMTIGTKTAGVDGNMSYIPIQNGILMAFSSLGIYYPDGGKTQRVGVSDNRDEVRERALEIIRNARPYKQYELYYKALENKMGIE